MGIVSVLEFAISHNPAEAVTENSVDPTCTADGSYDAVIYCSTCGESDPDYTNNMALYSFMLILGVLSLGGVTVARRKND